MPGSPSCGSRPSRHDSNSRSSSLEAVSVRSDIFYTNIRAAGIIPVINAARSDPARAAAKVRTPSRAVTLTLPDHVIEALTAGDPDLGRAIVRLTPKARKQAARPAELCHFGSHAVIVVSPTRTLEKRAGVELVPLPDGRALIAFPQSTTRRGSRAVAGRCAGWSGPQARRPTIFESVLEVIRDARRSDDVSLVHRSIIVLETRRPAAPRKTSRSAV